MSAHHRKCAAFGFRGGECNRNCADITLAIEAFNGDDSQTHMSNEDGREHRYARFPILAEDCDYEIVGFSGVQGCRL